jgi:hypothetical protein
VAIVAIVGKESQEDRQRLPAPFIGLGKSIGKQAQIISNQQGVMVFHRVSARGATTSKLNISKLKAESVFFQYGLYKTVDTQNLHKLSGENHDKILDVGITPTSPSCGSRSL